MTKQRKELFFYTLYTDADEVCIFETRRQAVRAKQAWSKAWTVRGPFQHIRTDPELVIAAKRAADLLSRLASTSMGHRDDVLDCAKALQSGIAKTFPFRRAFTFEGDSIELHPNA